MILELSLVSKKKARCQLASEQSSIIRNVSQRNTASASFINTRNFMFLLGNHHLKTHFKFSNDDCLVKT